LLEAPDHITMEPFRAKGEDDVDFGVPSANIT
jgi:hypothetical protein